MIVSPASSFSASSFTVDSVGPPAGTMTQMCARLGIAETFSASEPDALRAFTCERLDASALRSYATICVAVPHEPARHVRAHPAESDHSELHHALLA